MHELRVRRTHHAAAVTGWVLLVAVAIVWGHRLLPGGQLNVRAPPFQGIYRFAPIVVLPSALYAVAGVAVLPLLAARLPWRVLLSVSWAAAAGWAAVLNGWDGHRSLGSAVARPHEYLAAVQGVGDDPLGWLRGFVVHLGQQPVHVKGHPPLMVLVFWTWDRVGASGALWAGALVIAVGSSAVVAVAITVRVLAGEEMARSALSFLVLAPFAITVATSADAFFTGVAAWSAAALALGVQRAAKGWLLLAGLLAGALPYLSYGLLTFGAVLLAVARLAGSRGHGSVRVRRLRPSTVTAAAGGLVVVPLLMTVGGFWWFSGARATHAQWQAGLGDDRPYLYSFVADLAVLAVLVGPAAVAGLANRSPGPIALLASAALTAVVVLDLSGVTRLEVERIWLPFAPWVMVTCVALRGRTRIWLAVNALVALTFQLFVLDVW